MGGLTGPLAKGCVVPDFQVAQRERVHLSLQETWVGPLGREDPLQPTPVFLPGDGLQSTGSQRTGHDGVTECVHTHVLCQATAYPHSHHLSTE